MWRGNFLVWGLQLVDLDTSTNFFNNFVLLAEEFEYVPHAFSERLHRNLSQRLLVLLNETSLELGNLTRINIRRIQKLDQLDQFFELLPILICHVLHENLHLLLFCKSLLLRSRLLGAHSICWHRCFDRDLVKGLNSLFCTACLMILVLSDLVAPVETQLWLEVLEAWLVTCIDRLANLGFGFGERFAFLLQVTRNCRLRRWHKNLICTICYCWYALLICVTLVKFVQTHPWKMWNCFRRGTIFRPYNWPVLWLLNCPFLFVENGLVNVHIDCLHSLFVV